jgi:hypothetical protein
MKIPLQKPAPKKAVPYSTKQFYMDDCPRTLFPLNTNKVIIEHGEVQIRSYLDDCQNGSRSFSPQHRVYGAKDALHLRRTVKLDPVAEYFIYDLVYRNRTRFRKPHLPERAHYGYRFENGTPMSASKDYQSFKANVWWDNDSEKAFIGFDISNYFNALYHHDLEAWLAALDAPYHDVQLFSKFLREINAGRSVDCLPHGLYPTKMIGNDFLRFIEESSFLNATSIHRFMDDVFIFGDSLASVEADFNRLQRTLGLKGLSVNSSKTSVNTTKAEQTEASISAVKKKLLIRRRELVSSSLYDFEDFDETTIKADLSEEELAEVHDILKTMLNLF